MRSAKLLSLIMLVSLVIALASPLAAAQQAVIATVEVSPATLEAEVGQKVKFTATAKDASGGRVNQAPVIWFAAPSDLAAADENGEVTFYSPGEVRVSVLFPGNKRGNATVMVKPAAVASIDIEPLAGPIVVNGAVRLGATARAKNGDPRAGAAIAWESSDPAVARVDAAGLVVGLKAGKAELRASSGAAKNAVTIEVVENPVAALSIEPATTSARTGDVVRFSARARGRDGQAVSHPFVRWSVTGEGAMIESDGGFVAERPGTYVVTATSGDRQAVASVEVAPRNVEREVEVVGRVPVKDFMAAEQWVFGNHAYLSTISDKLLVYDVSDPANPKLTETVKLDARLLNDVSTTPDGRIGVVSREGASNRKNGIVFLDTSDPSHPKVISEFTETVTGGVHSAFVYSHYVYLTDDATGSLRIIDFKDVKRPKEVARWQVETAAATPIIPATVRAEGMGNLSGRYLHDVQVKDGLAYLAYWRDGIVILDVGNGMKGGSPERPQLVGQFRFNYHELYGNGWIAGAHAVYRYKNYLFVGDEVFPAEFELGARTRFPVRGIVHVLDVSDLSRPRKVAEYAVPEAGSHNIWIENDVMYMGYYSGGGRVLDVSGELRGDLYRQGREIARVWTGDPEGYRANEPLTWGAQPHKGMIFFNDINTGLWIVKLGGPKQKGATTAPGN